MPQLRAPDAPGKSFALTQHPRPAYGAPTHMGYALRDDRFRYVEWRELATGAVAARELYDHRTDPRETVNRAAEAARGTAPRGEPGGMRAEARRERAENRAALQPLRARLKAVEAALEKLGKEVALIEKRLGDPDTYARFKAEDIAWANTRRAAITKEVAGLEEEWLELSEKLEDS